MLLLLLLLCCCCACQRLVRSIFSTGQVPLLQQGDSQALTGPREFVVR
jgi:hypothetical protein